MTLFRGLSAFPLTPLDEAGEVDEAMLGCFLDRIVAAGADSIGLLGSTGGYAYLTREQRQRTLRVAVERVGGRVPIVVGVGALTTAEAVALARDARSAGADGLLLAPMSYLPLTDEEVFRHFVAVTEAGELPLCIYDNPGTTKFAFTVDLVARLAELPNVAAVKLPLPADGDHAGELARLRARTPDSFAVGYSGDWGAADALLAGCDAWYSVVAGLLPATALALTRAAIQDDFAEMRRLDDAFRPLWDLFRTYGSFRVMYAVADVLGFAGIAPPRPVLPLPSAELGRVAAAVRQIDRANAQDEGSTDGDEHPAG
ncbi:dihydrodipicolinate synthase family protein [Aureimonas leprariae]|uniref:Dihydrodipicolinate synthase family protein n=1 Tax=Plantimonas leprariae TaxID=2615207 RepID=A0A7V7PNI8_9HYPH|nr:dihydrodipicolinate synthase family protein [Aureimonas leprariae]KAB0679085.1 dihydrodipicolinate synthase family protein [Aureimonas leprariae]